MTIKCGENAKNKVCICQQFAAVVAVLFQMFTVIMFIRIVTFNHVSLKI